MKIFIEDTAGNRYEAEVDVDMHMSTIAADFFDAMEWPQQSADGHRQRAVVELVQAAKSLFGGRRGLRLRHDMTVQQANIHEGEVLRVYPETIYPEPMAGGQEPTKLHLQLIFIKNRKAENWEFEVDENKQVGEILKDLIDQNYPEYAKKNRPAAISKNNRQLLPNHFSVWQAGLGSGDTLLVGDESTIFGFLPFLALLPSTPNEILLRGLQNSMNYLREITQSELSAKPADLRRINECKLVFIGNGEVGKSSLIRWLIKGDFDPSISKTEKIDISEWSLHLSKHGQIRLNIWDFGGQEIMHSVHQLFMTSRSVYVLVANPRADGIFGIENELQYWLELISNLAPGTPVVVVVNKCETHISNLPKGKLKDDFPQIVDFVETSCIQKIGRDALIELIVKGLERLPHLQDEVPESYYYIKQKLQEQVDDVIPYHRYLETCREVDKKFTEQQADILAGLLHDLGVMLNFSQESYTKETQVLNPRWITAGIYCIINAPKLALSKGILSLQKVRDIWAKSEYTDPGEQDFILSLMLRFKLCYKDEQTEGKKEEQIHLYFPTAFPKDRPAGWSWTAAEELRFIFQYNLLPPFLISSFIVRNRRYLKSEMFWRDGCIIEDGEEKLEAFVESNPLQHSITIKVKGTGNKRSLLNFIRKSVQEINEAFPKLKIEQMIPIPPDGQHFVSYKDLNAHLEVGKESYFDPQTKRDYKISELLGVVIEPNRKDKDKLIERLYALLSRDEMPPVFAEIGKRTDLRPDQKKEFTQLEARFNVVKKTSRQGGTEDETIWREFNKIRFDLISLIDEI